MGVHDGHRGRLKHRFLEHGLDSFEDHEALELLLFYAIPRRDTNPIAHQLLDRFGSLFDVLSAPREELEEVEGVSTSTTILFRLTQEIRQRALLNRKEIPLCTTKQIGDYLLLCFEGMTEETVFQLFLDRKGQLLCRRRAKPVFQDNALLDVSDLIRTAVYYSASSVVIAHNHPSGIAVPSPEDYIATDRVRAALETMGISLRDHIIVAAGDYVSLRESGYL